MYERTLQSRRKDPPYPPVGGGASRMLRRLMLRSRAVLGTPKCEKSVGRRPRTPLGELIVPPRPSSWWGLAAPFPKNPTYNIVIVLVLCVCTHMYEQEAQLLLW